MENYIGNGPPLIVPMPGRLIQSRSHVRGDYLSLAVTIPLDDTIPQIGEGNEFLSVANFAPLLIGSRLRISVGFIFSPGSGSLCIGAIFRSGTPDALAVSQFLTMAAGVEGRIQIDYETVVASLAPFTYSFRAGLNAAGAVQMNGRGARTFGGANNTYLRIDEFSP
jgi:hypothetical protein